ncbi:MAG TPA: protocatechuate 3,4-dioxygenase subunit alpha [Hyphomicrobiaceae bacterium]|jgi:protocatechuate 3,4-dioxygenase, alpha subunit
MALRQTPSQTVGPFFSFGLAPEQYGYNFRSIAGSAVADDGTAGTRIRIVGRVFDGEGQPLNDALIEIWQADAEGRYAHPADPRSSNAAFKGFGRTGTGTDPESRFVFDTVMPGSVAGQAPHINVIVLARGMLNHLYTRLYFEDQAEANARDPILQSVPAERRTTLLARRDGATTYRFDIRLQGDAETVFFDV